MPPADNNTPTPTPQQPKKPGFWAKLFGGGKAAPSIVPPNHESQTPPPQLNDGPDAQQQANVTAPAGVDPITGAPQSPTTSSPDANGDVTAPSIPVPPSVQSPAEGETPTLPVQPPVTPETPVTPVQPFPPTTPTEPTEPTQPTDPTQPPASPQQ